MMLLVVLVLLATLSIVLAGYAPFPTCNIGPMHHAHMIIPVSPANMTLASCSAPSQKFLLSHGATFFCPHTWDIKLLATVAEDAARVTLCQDYFNSIEKGLSPMYIFRPTLDQGGLPAEALGQLTQWSSPYIYHVHNFGDDNDAGIGNGWNTTTIVDTDTTVNIERVLYSQQLQLMIAPPSLTYLMHAPYSTVPGAAPGTIVLTHYITTAGPSGFDHIVTANVFPADTSNPLPFRPTWPLFLTFDGTTDAFANKLTTTGGNYTASLNVYDETTLEPVTIAVIVQVAIDYYSGTCDGFAGFCTLCPNVGSPESPSVCLTNTTTILNDPSAMPTEAPAESAGKAKTSHVVWNVVALVSGLLLIIWLGYYYYQKNYVIDNSREPSNGNGLSNDNPKYTKF